LFEGSGGINENNVLEYAKTGVDILSMGSLTSGVKSVDMSFQKILFFFKYYNDVHAIVEFEQGTLTSETLILAVESASDQKHVYKAKFLE
jgi:hypothetical protein